MGLQRSKMSCAVTFLSFIFLFSSALLQVISFLTSHMVTNRLSNSFHDGIFQRCGAMQYFQTARQYVNSFRGKDEPDGSVVSQGGCFWWNSQVFQTDEKSLRAVVVLSLISCGVLGLAVLFFLISLIDRFKRKGLNLFIGVLMMVNAVIIGGVIIVYTLLYAKDAKMTPDEMTPLLFSWSYWMLYAVAGGNLFTSILYCINPVRHGSHYI